MEEKESSLGDTRKTVPVRLPDEGRIRAVDEELVMSYYSAGVPC